MNLIESYKQYKSGHANEFDNIFKQVDEFISTVKTDEHKPFVFKYLKIFELLIANHNYLEISALINYLLLHEVQKSTIVEFSSTIYSYE